MKYDFLNNAFIETDRDANKPAISGSDGNLTWGELKSQVDKLVAAFKQLNIPAGHPVLIYGHKERFYPVAILACMQCNLPYIPTDKIFPPGRIEKILSLSGSQVMVNCTAQSLDLQVPVVIHSSFAVVASGKSSFEGAVYGSPDNAMRYIMFTSGSTGEPKGVQISAKALSAFVAWLQADFHFTSADVFTNQAPFTFDISLYDLCGALSSGASLVLNTGELATEQETFLKRLKDYKCTIWNSTPSFVYLFLRNPQLSSEYLPHLREFIFMGEELPNRTVSMLKQKFPHAKVLNAYGPTEATVITTSIEITDDILKQYPSLPIGYAMPGSELIIEKSGDSKEGELIIAGDHVSSGYLKNDPLNRQKFLIVNGKRAFRTGDLAYYENNLLFFIGRNDEQVKMNGYRIELPEISNVMLDIAEVTDAVTVALKRNNEVKKIISFVKLKQGSTFSKEELISFLQKKLPVYMIPGDIKFVDEFPYSASHKVDKKKLIEDYLR